ncbi:phospholipid carrier-dependent glycosyltransferase [Pontibacter fetidus]|uniref:Glycosyltransferase family 39 protein n=1 Tax=Pontibacter fetidus TaxID=2700082 RepID=A0A6B2H5U4_9BACT|nr:glycosyltransferase family 39 protein [Pontibacter fetidus]NDK55677.1 glycosyltransferase family 39 protein [Pontibacter fetidus]
MPLQHGLFRGRSYWFILLILLAALLYNLGGWGVLETSEARYAEISREMLASRDWLHPQLLGIGHYHKPPVTYVISAAGMALLGVNGFGVRFFLQLSFLLQALLVYQLGWLLFRDKGIAIVALVVYVTMPAVLISARNLTTDSFLTTFELLAIWAWVKYKYKSKAAWLYLFYSLLAVAFLTKGPVGLIFPVLVVLAMANYRSAATKHHTMHYIVGFMVFLGLSASWYVYLMLQNPQFVDYFLMKHTVERYANPEAFSRSKPWWFYLVLAPLLSLPWSAMLLLNLKKIRALPAKDKRLFILWLLVPLVFFSLSGSKLILYILPLFAGLALLTAWLLQELLENKLRRSVTAALVYYGILALAFIVAPLILAEIQVPIWCYIFPGLMLAGLYFIWRSDSNDLSKLLAGALVFTVLLLPFSTHLLGNNQEQVNSTSQVAAALQKPELAQRRVIVYDQLLPSLAFELNRNFVTIQDKNRHLNRETQFETNENWRQNLLNPARAQDSIALVNLLQQNIVLIVKGELPPNRKWLTQNCSYKQKIGKWVLHY